jgi:nitrite reductase/ring-hydroxylating ferredoxin subunit
LVVRKYDDSEPRDDHGQWTAGGGGGAAERATASLSDHAFVTEHMGRLQAAGDEARAAFPREVQAHDEAHSAAQTAIHAEAMRIHAENDAMAGQDHAELKASADARRDYRQSIGESLADQHAAVMARIEERKGELAGDRELEQRYDQTVAAGHVTTDLPHEAADRFTAEHERITTELSTIHDNLDEAHGAAAEAIAHLNSMAHVDEDGESEIDWSGKIDKTTELYSEFDATSGSFSEQLGKPERDASFDPTESESYGGREDTHAEFPAAPESFDHESERPEHEDLGDKPEPPEHDPEATPEENAQAHEDYEGELETWNTNKQEQADEQADYERRAAEHKEATATYEHALAAHEAEFKARAAAAQTALETLHERQVAAASRIPGLEKEHDAAKAAAVSEIDNIKSSSLVNHTAVAGDDAARDRANEVAEAILSTERSNRSDDERSLSVDSIKESLKSETRATAAAIKQLARVTGREPRLPAKPTRAKKANRPDGAQQASVEGMAPRYKLRLTKLDFVSPVDTPAQETATTLLIKRAGPVTGFARVAKVDEGLGLVFCWAFTSKVAGADYHDLQGDAIDEDFIKAAAEFMTSGGGATDEMHDGKQTGRVVFAMPMTPEIAKAYGVESPTSGLMVALKPPPDVLAKFKSGEYTGVSIAGSGTREPLSKTAKPTCAACKAYMGADDTACKGCGMAKAAARKAAWTTADIDSLPDTSFLYLEPGGKRDAGGKTTPRSLRHFPYRDAAGKVDIDHLRDAIGRIPQSSLEKTLRDKLQVKAEKLLAAQHSKRVAKQAVLTSEADGHVHSIDLDDPADEWRDSLSTSYQVSTDATTGHSHAWTYDPATGAVTIAMDSGHDHSVSAVVPADVMARAAAQDLPKCPNCGSAWSAVNFCPHCGARMDGGDGVPNPITDEKSSGATVLAISLRAAAGKSPLAGAAPTVKQEPKEHTPMATENEKTAELEKRAARFEKMSTLTDAARAHFGKLAGSEAEAFLAKSVHEREVILADIAKADEVVHTSLSGRVFRKSDSVDLITMAKQLDELTVSKQRAETEAKDIAFASKGDSTLSNFAKGAKGNLRGRIMKALNAEFTVPAEYEEAIEAMKGMNAAFAKLGVPQGHDGNGLRTPSDAPESPAAKLDLVVAEHAKKNNVPIAKAYAAVLNTAEGAQLYAQIPVGRA